MSRRSLPWQVWFADLSPTTGNEQSGRRPVVLVASPLYAAFPITMTIAVPLTTKDRGLDHHIPITSPAAGLPQRSWARTDDIRALSEHRLVGRQPLGYIDSAKDRNAIRRAITDMIDLNIE